MSKFSRSIQRKSQQSNKFDYQIYQEINSKNQNDNKVQQNENNLTLLDHAKIILNKSNNQQLKNKRLFKLPKSPTFRYQTTVTPSQKIDLKNKDKFCQKDNQNQEQIIVPNFGKDSDEIKQQQLAKQNSEKNLSLKIPEEPLLDNSLQRKKNVIKNNSGTNLGSILFQKNLDIENYTDRKITKLSSLRNQFVKQSIENGNNQKSEDLFTFQNSQSNQNSLLNSPQSVIRNYKQLVFKDKYLQDSPASSIHRVIKPLNYSLNESIGKNSQNYPKIKEQGLSSRNNSKLNKNILKLESIDNHLQVETQSEEEGQIFQISQFTQGQFQAQMVLNEQSSFCQNLIRYDQTRNYIQQKQQRDSVFSSIHTESSSEIQIKKEMSKMNAKQIQENTRNNQSIGLELSGKLSEVYLQNSVYGQNISNLINITQDTELNNFLNQEDFSQRGLKDKIFSPKKKKSSTFALKTQDQLLDEESQDNFNLFTKPEIQQIIASVRQKQKIEKNLINKSVFHQLKKKESQNNIKNKTIRYDKSSSDEDLIEQETERIVLPIRVQTHNPHMQDLLQYSNKKDASLESQIRQDQFLVKSKTVPKIIEAQSDSTKRQIEKNSIINLFKDRPSQQSLEMDFQMLLLLRKKESKKSSLYSINQIEQLNLNIYTPESKRSKEWPIMEYSPTIKNEKSHLKQQPCLQIQLQSTQEKPNNSNEISIEQDNQFVSYVDNQKKKSFPIVNLQKDKITSVVKEKETKNPDSSKYIPNAKTQKMKSNQLDFAQQTLQTQSIEHPSKIIHKSIESKREQKSLTIINDSNLKEDIHNSQNLMISDTSSKLESQDIAILYEQLSEQQMRSIEMNKINQKSPKKKASINITGKTANVLQKLEARRSRVQEYFIKRDELQVPKTDVRKKTKTKNSCSNSKLSTQTKKTNTLYQTQKLVDQESKQKGGDKNSRKSPQNHNENQFDKLFASSQNQKIWEEQQVLYQKTTANNSEKDLKLNEVIDTDQIQDKKIYLVESPKIIKQIEIPYSQIPNSAQILQLMESTTGKNPESEGLSLRIGKKTDQSATAERRILSNDEKQVRGVVQEFDDQQPNEFQTFFHKEQQNQENEFFDIVKIDKPIQKKSKSSSKLLESYNLTSSRLQSEEKQEIQIKTVISDDIFNSLASDKFQPYVIRISESQLKFEKFLILQKIEQNGLSLNIDQPSSLFKTPILSLNNTPAQKNLLTDKKLSLTSGQEQTQLILTPENFLQTAPQQKRKSGRLTLSGQNSSSSKIDLASKAFPGALNFTQLNDYRMGRMLGQGAYALVREAIHIQTGFTVAIKIYDKNKLNQNVPIMKSVQREIKMLTYLSKTSLNQEAMIQYGNKSPESIGFNRKMSLKSIEAEKNISLGHPSLMKLYDAIDQKRQLFIILESCKGEELHKVVKKYSEGMGGSRKNLSEEICAKIMYQLLEGMKFYHAENICHRDLKLENILVDIETPNCQTKIIDFGFATQTDSCEDTLNNFCGTPAYMAPEMVLKQEYSGPAIDIWAAGVVFYTILFGAQPFKAKTEADLFSKISKGKFSFPKSSHQDFVKNKILKSSLGITSRNDNERIQNAIRLSHIQMTDGSTGGPTDQFLEPEFNKNFGNKSPSTRNSIALLGNRQNSSKALMKIIEKHKGGNQDSGLFGSIGGQFTDMMSEQICYSRMAKELVQEMLTIDQKYRPSAAELLQKYRQWFKIHSAIF